VIKFDPGQFKWWLCSLLLAASLFIADRLTVRAEGAVLGFMREHPIPGAALNIVAEAPGRLWFTMPAANAIGSLVVTTTVQFTQYTIPTANSQPYDLAYANGVVWFTERTANKIGRLRISDGVIDEFVLPTANSQPTGIALSPGGFVWVCTRGSHQIIRFDPQSNTFDEYTYAPATAQLEEIAAVTDQRAWATAPSHNEVIFVDRLDAQFPILSVSTLPYLEPVGIAVDVDGQPWVTPHQGNFVLRYAPGTLSLWRPYPIPTSESGPTTIVYRNRGATWELWYVQNASSKAGQVVTRVSSAPVSLRDHPLPTSNAQPWGITVDAAGHAWITSPGSNAIVEWQPPYFEFIYLPLVQTP
jgi:virginiamycin B lyase